MFRHAVKSIQLIVTTLFLSSQAASLQDAAPTQTAGAYAAGSCLDATSKRQRPPAYCGEAQRLYGKLTYHSKTAIIDHKQLKSFLFDDHDDRAMWQFLALNLAEKSPYFASGPRKRDLAAEIRESLDMQGRPDRVFGFAADILDLRGRGANEAAPKETLELLSAQVEKLLLAEDDAQLLVTLGHATIGLGQVQFLAQEYDSALKTLAFCEQIFEKSGSRLLPQSCYAQLGLTGNAPAEFLRAVAEREENLTCGRDLVSLCNLFRKTGHGKFLAPAAAN